MTEATYTTSSRTKLILVAAAVVLAFFAAYGFASARTQPSSVTVGDSGLLGAAGTEYDVSSIAAQSSECGGDCCGSATAEVVEGSAVVEGEVQRIAVDVSEGFFNPGAIRLAAGIPAVITFGEGSGCMAEVMFKDFGVFENLTQGGALVEIPALQPGEYEFSCGMEMVYGSLIVD